MEENMETISTHKKSKSKPFLIGCGALIVIGIVAVIFVVYLVVTGPKGGVKMSNEMEEYAIEYIETNKLLNDTESLIAYYDATLSLNGSESAILTTERILYHKDGHTTSINLKDIEDVHHRYEKFLGDIVEIKSKYGARIKIEIAPLNQGESFHNALRDAWKSVSE